VPGGSSEWTWDKVKSVSYLEDCILESLRLKPALMSGAARETPAQGVQIDEVHIPGNTNVIVSAIQIHRDPRYWQQAEEFIPERWSERRAEMGTDTSPYFPFSLGECIRSRLSRQVVNRTGR
jgi:cytochrome P450